mmetsp:Transcript_4593/g.8679  ORF Transcript_4593/g.8679 Transcript_4593/m.8679 type:complete len:243 (+) Transcript_4593:1106-1834(+)
MLVLQLAMEQGLRLVLNVVDVRLHGFYGLVLKAQRQVFLPNRLPQLLQLLLRREEAACGHLNFLRPLEALILIRRAHVGAAQLPLRRALLPLRRRHDGARCEHLVLRRRRLLPPLLNLPLGSSDKLVLLLGRELVNLGFSVLLLHLNDAVADLPLEVLHVLVAVLVAGQSAHLLKLQRVRAREVGSHARQVGGAPPRGHDARRQPTARHRGGGPRGGARGCPPVGHAVGRSGARHGRLGGGG